MTGVLGLYLIVQVGTILSSCNHGKDSLFLLTACSEHPSGLLQGKPQLYPGIVVPLLTLCTSNTLYRPSSNLTTWKNQILINMVIISIDVNFLLISSSGLLPQIICAYKSLQCTRNLDLNMKFNHPLHLKKYPAPSTLIS